MSRSLPAPLQMTKMFNNEFEPIVEDRGPRLAAVARSTGAGSTGR
jgi:hypothetical protein